LVEEVGRFLFLVGAFFAWLKTIKRAHEKTASNNADRFV